MSYRVMFVINALVTLLAGLGFLIVPGRLLALFGTEARVPELLLARFFGSALLTLGLLLWFAKDAADEGAQKGMGIALLVGAFCGLVVTVIGVSPASGVIRSNGWAAIVVYVLFGLGYAYLVFLKPRAAQ